MTVYTGLRRRAGTTSNIYFVLRGSEDDSEIRFLSNGERKVKCIKIEKIPQWKYGDKLILNYCNKIHCIYTDWENNSALLN